MKSKSRHKLVSKLEVGQEHTVKIISIGAKGDGVAKIDGKVVFITGAEMDKTYNIKIYKVLQNVAFADII